MEWQVGGTTLDVGRGRILMGVVNVTPDSFSDGGQFYATAAAVAHARRLVTEGAAVLDIGGESSRPGSDPVSAGEEMRRVLPVVAAVHAEFPTLPISVDTCKAEVASAALAAGATIVNDVSALRADADMARTVRETGAGLVLMHMQGTPRTMQHRPSYRDVVAEVSAFLRERRDAAMAAGIRPSAIALDPGFGFGKTVDHNLRLLRAFSRFTDLGHPLVAGLSRKSTLAHLLGNPQIAPAERLWPGVAFTSYLREAGAHVLRVHEIGPHLAALRMTEAILAA